MQTNQKEKLGLAVVGLGGYSNVELKKALKSTQHCKVMGVVSDSPEKCDEWRLEFNLKDKNLYHYDNFDGIKNNSDIDIVYIALPNDLHSEFVIRAAEAGKHVITEKPIDTNIEDAERMIAACRNAGVKLSIGYRLHFDPYNLEMMRLGQTQYYGPVKKVIARNARYIGDKNQWRLVQYHAGGGPLMDLGVYCVQGAIYTIGELPVSVKGAFHKKTDPEKFSDVEEGISWEMEFPGGAVAYCDTSYSHQYQILRAEAERGWFEISPAFEYRDLKGTTSDGEMKFEEVDQQTLQMDDFALCVKENRESKVPGEMGLRDLQILLAIYESAKTGKQVRLHLEPFENLVEM